MAARSWAHFSFEASLDQSSGGGGQVARSTPYQRTMPVGSPAAPAPAVWASVAMKLLPLVLSLVAGSVDAISFLGLGGLFAAHITGNVVILAAHMATGNAAPMAQMLSVPVFMLALLLTRFLAARLEAASRGTLSPLLLVQFLLIAGFLGLAIAGGVNSDRLNSWSAIVAGMLGVSAMAVQNALVQISLPQVPSTAVMTTNITRFTVDIGQVLFCPDPAAAAEARQRAKRTLSPIAGFAVGCAAGAFAQASFGFMALALPTALALLALVLGILSQARK